MCRSGVDSATGLRDFSWASLVALVSIDRLGRCERRVYSHILGLSMAEGDARKYMLKVMSMVHPIASYFDVVISRTSSCMRAR